MRAWFFTDQSRAGSRRRSSASISVSAALVTPVPIEPGDVHVARWRSWRPSMKVIPDRVPHEAGADPGIRKAERAHCHQGERSDRIAPKHRGEDVHLRDELVTACCADHRRWRRHPSGHIHAPLTNVFRTSSRPCAAIATARLPVRQRSQTKRTEAARVSSLGPDSEIAPPWICSTWTHQNRAVTRPAARQIPHRLGNARISIARSTPL